MAPRHIPDRDQEQMQFIPSLRPSGSATVISLWDVVAGVRLPMLRWGDCIYSPVHEGMRFAVDIHNGRDHMIAVPVFIEGTNLWVGGPAEPEACSPSHMWELNPRQTMRVDALMNPAGQRGRPIVITRTGLGATVGEATFGTDAYRGQLRIYERHPITPEPAASPGPAPPGGGAGPAATVVAREKRVGAEPGAPSRAMPASAAPRSPPAMAAPAAAMAPPAPALARSAPAGVASPAAAPTPTGAPAPMPGQPAGSIPLRGQAGFGAGDDEVREHHFTGVDYHRLAMPLLSLRTEMRDDLEPMVRAQLGGAWSWQWQAPWGDDWIARAWMWPVPPLAPHIPVTRPPAR